MAWTSPATWVANTVLTAAQLNAQVRDNLKAIGDPLGSWSPAWTGATTNPVIGNGSIVGKYAEAGKWVRFSTQITMGTTTTYGSGVWRLNLPVTPAAGRWIFTGTARDASAPSTWPLFFEWDTGSSLLIVRTWPTTAGDALRVVGGASPFTWATTDELFVSGDYEAA